MFPFLFCFFLALGLPHYLIFLETRTMEEEHRNHEEEAERKEEERQQEEAKKKSKGWVSSLFTIDFCYYRKYLAGSQPV